MRSERMEWLAMSAKAAAGGVPRGGSRGKFQRRAAAASCGCRRGAVDPHDTERAEVFNGVVRNLSADPPPAAMREFTGEEVRRYRRGPWWRCASRASAPWA